MSQRVVIPCIVNFTYQSVQFCKHDAVLQFSGGADTDTAGFCPPLGTSKLCSPDPHIGHHYWEMQKWMYEITFGFLHRVYELPRGLLDSSGAKWLGKFSQNVLAYLEVARRLLCAWNFRLCWHLQSDALPGLTSVGVGLNASSDSSAIEWRRHWNGLCKVLQNVGLEMQKSAAFLFVSVSIPPPHVFWTLPDQSLKASPGIITDLTTRLEVIEASVLAVTKPLVEIAAGAVRQIISTGVDLGTEMRRYSSFFQGSELPLCLYPPDGFGSIAGRICRPVADHWPVHRREREDEAGVASTAFDMSGLRMHHRSIEEALAALQTSGHELSYKLVNLGAMDGACTFGAPAMDPANCLVRRSNFLGRSWGGVVVEANPKKALLKLLARRSDVLLVPRAIYPESVAAIFEGATLPQAPASFDLLKIDLDSFDCDVVATLLRVQPLLENPPKLIYIDFNPHIPPPFLYRTISASDARLVPFQGSSLQCFLAAAPGFLLLHVELFNAVLVRRDLRGAFPELGSGVSVFEQWALGYFCHPLARTLWQREEMARRLGADPVFWADKDQSLAVRGEDILRCLGRLRQAEPSFQFSLTW